MELEASFLLVFLWERKTSSLGSCDLLGSGHSCCPLISQRPPGNGRRNIQVVCPLPMRRDSWEGPGLPPDFKILASQTCECI
jgi:hypothetical protein